MFAVGLLYSSQDFLRLNTLAGMTPDEFQNYFKTFKYSKSEKILQVSFKCGWAKVTPSGTMEITERGLEISKSDYKSGLLLQLEDLILNFNPSWGALLTKGRTEAKNFLPDEVNQCFKECGLFGELNDDLIKFWDKLSLAYRNYTHKRMTEIGRMGEKLSFDHELKRTGSTPKWQSVESNLSGFDILSIIDDGNQQKLKIEVKATTSKIDYAKIHLSKHEWNTAKESLNYCFHLWEIKEEHASILYQVSSEEMEKHIPIDNGDGDWESVEIPFKSLINKSI